MKSDSLKEQFNQLKSDVSEFLHTMLHSNLPRVFTALIIAFIIGGTAIVLTEGGGETFSSFFSAVW